MFKPLLLLQEELMLMENLLEIEESCGLAELMLVCHFLSYLKLLVDPYSCITVPSENQ